MNHSQDGRPVVNTAASAAEASADHPPPPPHPLDTSAAAVSQARSLHSPSPSSSAVQPRSILRTSSIAASPATRERARSLRQAVFAKGIRSQLDGNAGPAEDEAGPSIRRPTLTRFITPERWERNDGRKKGNGPEVVVSPVIDDELPLRPGLKSPQNQPRRKRPAPIAHKRQPVRDLASQLETAFHALKKRVLRVKDIPPSKDGRHIELDASQTAPLVDERTSRPYISNMIRSSRYTIWNFLPKQIVFQFGKIANFYFLVISILQMIPGLSTTGTYTTIVPLLVFISISMAKEGYDDVRRNKLDKQENRKIAKLLRPRGGPNSGNEVGELASSDSRFYWADLMWQDVRVGDIVRLDRDDPVPADIVLLHSDGLNNVAYIETMALDGETNLKAKQPSPHLAKACTSVDQIAGCNARFVVEDPNVDLYNFDGRVTVNGETLPLTTNEVVYRGSVLRNTSQAIGIVINTGEECKIRMNANKNPRIKAPSLQAIVNKVVIIVVLFVLFLALFNTAAYQVWANNVESRSWYLIHARVPFGPILTGFIIMFNTMIPLSLYVSLEIIKLGQLFLMQDIDMYDPVSNTPMEAHTTTINEELGQVSYIFSDKTGTLTDNEMRFRKMSVAGFAWLHDFDLQNEVEMGAKEDSRTPPLKGKDLARMQSYDSAGSHFTANYSMSTNNEQNPPPEVGIVRRSSTWKSSARPAKSQLELRTEDMLRYLQRKPHTVFARKARFFLLSLALCHTCLPETKDDGSVDFQSASPDELALVRAAQELEYIVVDRAAQTITVKSRPGGHNTPEIREVYEVLDIIEFSSKRKRMSIVIRFPDGRRCIFCKGADTIIMKRLKQAPLARQKAVEIERRSSVRKSLEVEQALRRQSEVEGSPTSFAQEQALGRRSIGSVSRSGSVRLPVRDEIDTWLRERESDVDLASVDSPAAYIPSRSSLHHERTTAPFSPTPPVQEDEVDDLVDEAIAMDEAAVFERCFQHIDDFATEGLRTLLYGFRFLDEEEYVSWKQIYHDASTSLVNRQELIESAGDVIEKDFELAGATAIEDKLQKGVPETIDKLRRANIKMWMLTGDKRETAINIGHSCRLIKDYSTVIILDHEAGKLEQNMSTSLAELEGGAVPHAVVVVDGQTLSDIERDEILASLFFDLAVIADSVICCRASPSQKALLVKKIRERINGSVTLAIGDGANDIAMIQEAHVGIGITGKEGLQAARISDYSIAQFRFLQKLLLVHGRWNYIRTAKYVLGTFWKETLFYLTQAMYQRWNGYTGTSFYESWSLSMFNTLFTSLCVIFLGIFEQDLRATTLLAVPELYSYGQRNEAFNFAKYFGWMFLAASEAVVIYFLTYGLFALQENGNHGGIFAIGDLSFTCCILVINTKLLFVEMHRKTFISAIGLGLSIVGWILWNVILSFVYSPKDQLAYGVRSGFVKHFGSNPNWWLVVLVIFVAFLVYEYGIISLRQAFLPSDVDVFQELEQDPVLAQRFRDAAVASGAMSIPQSDIDRERAVQDMLDRPRGGKFSHRRRSSIKFGKNAGDEMEMQGLARRGR